MNPNRFKMFSVERLSLLLMAILLIIWVIIVLLEKRNSGREFVETDFEAFGDTSQVIYIATNDSAVLANEKSISKDTKLKKSPVIKTKPKKSKGPIKKRDHLHEPVPGR